MRANPLNFLLEQVQKLTRQAPKICHIIIFLCGGERNDEKEVSERQIYRPAIALFPMRYRLLAAYLGDKKRDLWTPLTAADPFPTVADRDPLSPPPSARPISALPARSWAIALDLPHDPG